MKRTNRVGHAVIWFLCAGAALALQLPAAAQWEPIGEEPQEYTRAITFARIDSTTVYALVGQNNFGVFYSLSTDNGYSWSGWTPTWLDEYRLWDTPSGWPASVNAVASVGATVVAGTSEGQIYFSSDSSGNYLTPWTLSAGIPSGYQITDMVAAGGDILACVHGQGIFKSTNCGADFTLVAGTSGAGSGLFMGVFPHGDYSSTGKFWAVTDQNGELPGGIYLWNGGWTDRSPTGYWFSFGSVTSSPGPGEPEALWAGDLSGTGVWESLDQGQTWNQRGVICDSVLALATAPDYTSTNKHLLIGTSWGFKESKEGAVKALYPAGIPINSIAAGPAGTGTVFLATGSGVKEVYPGFYPEDISRQSMALFDISDVDTSPNYLIDQTVFALSRQLGLFVSRDGGQSFSMYMTPLQQSQSFDPGYDLVGFGPSPAFNGDTGACFQEASTVYLATKGRGIFRSSSGGSGWVPINDGLTGGGGLNISAFAVAPNTYSYPLYAAREGFSTIVRFEGSSGDWFETPLPEPFASWVYAIAFPRLFPNPSVIYVGTDTGLFYSTDAGATFMFDEMLPPAPSMNPAVTGIGFHPDFDNDLEQTVFVARGGTIFKKVFIEDHWEWTTVGGGSFPSGDYFVDKIAVSPIYNFDGGTVAVSFIDPMDPAYDGVWLSSDGGLNFYQINGIYPNHLRDRYPISLRFVPLNSTIPPTAVRLFAGTRQDRLQYSDSTSYSYWFDPAGWETSPPCVNSLAVSTVPTPTECGLWGTTATDIFMGTCKGVFWSNDGGDTFRPINEGLVNTFTGDGCSPYEITSLHIESADTVNGIHPVLIAGTEGAGIWFRHATPDAFTGGWDWSTNNSAFPPEPVWHQSNVTSGTINGFSRETGMDVIRAATSDGVLSSTGMYGALGVIWEPVSETDTFTSVCHGSWTGGSLRQVPEAPQSGTIWGTTWGTGVKKGTESPSFGGHRPEVVSWETRNGTGAGTHPEFFNYCVIQLDDGTLLTGGTIGSGIYRSPDEGLKTWYPSSGGLENTTKKVRAFTENTDNDDVFCAVEGSGNPNYNGGVFISADKGLNWACISAGFNPSQQVLSDIIKTQGNPPVYYAGTFSQGSYATTVSPLSPPTISSIDVSSGPSSGGTTVTLTGTNFRCDCGAANGLQAYDCVHFGISQPVASFGGIDASTTSCSSTQLVVTTPKHPTGKKVSVTVRNPDTRSATLSGAYEFTDSSDVTMTMSRDGSNRIVISWSGSGTPTKVYRSPNKDFSGWLDARTVSGSPYTYEDASGTDSLVYYYRVE